MSVVSASPARETDGNRNLAAASVIAAPSTSSSSLALAQTLNRSARLIVAREGMRFDKLPTIARRWSAARGPFPYNHLV